MSTSFKKKTTRGHPALPKGTKPSLNNNQLLISTGVPSLDALIGGGLPVGTVLLIEEDQFTTYSSLLTKFFLAEGASNDHVLFIASADAHPEQLLKELPLPVNMEVAKTSSKMTTDMPKDRTASLDDNLKIAWRYQNVASNQKASGVQFGRYFDLSTEMSEEQISRLHIETFHASPRTSPQQVERLNPVYRELLGRIEAAIEKHNLSITTSTSITNILRVCIPSLASPFWRDALTSMEATERTFDPSCTWFLLALRSVLRRSYAAAVVSMPTHLFPDESTVRRVESCVDIVVSLDSFQASPRELNPAFKEYHGLFYVRKLSRLNSIAGVDIDNSDLAFKLRRKKFTIEKLHLPPDTSETVSRSQGSSAPLTGSVSGSACGGGSSSHLLEF